MFIRGFEVYHHSEKENKPSKFHVFLRPFSPLITSDPFGATIALWGFILGELKLLHLDHQLANISMMVGKIMIVIALIWGGVILARNLCQKSLR